MHFFNQNYVSYSSCATSFWSPWFLNVNPVIWVFFSYVRKGVISVLMLSKFSLCHLAFGSFFTMCFGVNSLGFILCGICLAFWICRYISFAKFVKSLGIVSFRSHPLQSFSSASGTLVIWTWDILLQSYRSISSVHFLISVYFLIRKNLMASCRTSETNTKTLGM